ncbi:MAG: hypothetical protein PHS17_11370 [Desulfobacterales bacterium]|nr:hypothetical protein [Desulfobacterales bacterium]
MPAQIFKHVHEIAHHVSTDSWGQLSAADDVDAVIGRMNLTQSLIQWSLPPFSCDRAVIGWFRAVIRAQKIGVTHKERTLRTRPAIRQKHFRLTGNIFSRDFATKTHQPLECKMYGNGRDEQVFRKERRKTF